MNRAAFFSHQEDGSVECNLCPHHCRIAEGRTGFCGVRRNRDGELESIAYGRPVSIAVDPIEKKPLRHFLEGSKVLSFGTYGCNLNCPWCQNAELSRGHYPDNPPGGASLVLPSQIVQLAGEHGCPSIAYTYNEPTVFYEYMLDCARAAREADLKNVLVSNAYMTEAPARELSGWIDAANFDMKGFDAEFYRREVGGELDDVLRTIEIFAAAGVHLELTTLLIPGLNDAPEQTDAWLDWVETHLSRRTPLHFSAYFPCHRCNRPATPAETVLAVCAHARRRGFTAVHPGNVR